MRHHRIGLLSFVLLATAPAWADAQPLQIGTNQRVAPVRKDMGDGLCATAVHATDPPLGQVAFNSLDDGLGLLNRTSSRLVEDGRVSTRFSLINFKNNDPVALGDFTGDLLFPYSENVGAAPPGNDRNFAMRLRGYINIDASESLGLQRTLGLFADDGARLRIGTSLVTVPDVDQRLSSRRIRQVQYSDSGMYPIELIYYQNGSLAVLELSETNQLVPENTHLTNLKDLGFTLVGQPRPNLFVNTELYTSRSGAVQSCVECNDDATCGTGSYCAKDWGPLPPAGLCQQCNVVDHCGPSCQACKGPTPICAADRCVQCLQDGDCGTDQVCNTTTNACEPVIHNWEYVGGCSAVQSTGTRGAGGAIPLAAVGATLLLLLLLRRRRSLPFRGGLMGAVLLLGLQASPAHAQLSANTETFRPAIGPENIITVEGTRTGQRLRPMFGVLLEYSDRPLRLIDRDAQRTIANTVPSLTSLHLLAGMGITRWLALAVDLPVVVYQDFDPATPTTDIAKAPDSYGVGDFRVVAKARIINNQQGGFGLAFVPQVTFPTGSGQALRGDDAYGIEPRLALDYRTPGGAIIAANVGFLGRTSNQLVRNMEVGSQMRYGLGMYVPLPEGFGLQGEVAGGTSVSRVADGPIYSPLEGHVGGRWVHSSGFNLNLGAGMGFTEAVGSPRFRFFASVGYFPMERKKVIVTPPPATGRMELEKSGSGAGRVVSQPGGIDCGLSCSADFRLGMRLVLRAQPDQNSNFVGWSGPCSGTEDCVVVVRGPTQVRAEFAHKEEKRALVILEKEGDGGGEVISDPSGISCGKVCNATFRQDQEVRFIAVPDQDSRFAGWEGACSGLAPCTIVVRGEPRLKARFIKRQIEVTPQKLDLKGNVIHFETAKAVIDIDSFHLLDEVVLILKENAQMRLRVEGHTDAVPFYAPGGNLQLSKDRAASVVQYLIEHGITGARLQSEGYGDTCPVATNQTEVGRQANRRTEFLVVDAVTGQAQRTPCVDYTPAPKMGRPRKLPAKAPRPTQQSPRQQSAP